MIPDATLVAALAACMRSKIWDPVEHKLQCMRRVLEEKDPVGDVPASLKSRLVAISELDRLKRVFARSAEAPSLAEVESVLA